MIEVTFQNTNTLNTFTVTVTAEELNILLSARHCKIISIK